MSTVVTSAREGAQSSAHPTVAGAGVESAAQGNHARARRTTPPAPMSRRYASDDEILGINTAAPSARGNATHLGDSESESADGATAADVADATRGRTDEISATSSDAPDNAQINARLQAALDSNPELQQAWQDAQSYRETFATPEEARAATALLSDLDRMDALFFSRRPEDHAELARAVANLDPEAFASLAKAMSDVTGNGRQGEAQPSSAVSRRDGTATISRPDDGSALAASPAQVEFLHAANAATVQGVIDAIETQVDRLLPEGVSKSARNRVIGEIYRELDASLGSNRQLGQQMRDAFRSGNLDAAHQRAVVSMITGRARQALPGIAKRVLNEWTSTVVAANQDRLARQRAAAHRVDIAGSGRGGDGARRSLGPRDIDYGRMSDSDILNL